METRKLSGVGAICAAKTHCDKGHPLSGDNLYVVQTGKRKGKRVCKACRNESMRNYSARNPDKMKVKWAREKKARADRYREIVFNHYGAFCHCCGIVEPEFLTLEHVGGGGGEHRKHRTHPSLVFLDVIREEFPPTYDILCFNCNMARRWSRTCPHQRSVVLLMVKDDPTPHSTLICQGSRCFD